MLGRVKKSEIQFTQPIFDLFSHFCARRLKNAQLQCATYQIVDKYQRKDKELVAKIKCESYYTKYFCVGGIITQLICRSDKIVMPTILQKYVVNWYNT